MVNVDKDDESRDIKAITLNIIVDLSENANKEAFIKLMTSGMIAKSIENACDASGISFDDISVETTVKDWVPKVLN